MIFYTFFYGLSIIIGLCEALPIPSIGNGVGERNMVIIGAVAFLSFGAVLAGCVCCRRRKKGFELNQEKDKKEFTNESGTLESNKTEYPIFRALSPETQQKNNENQGSTSIVIEDVANHQTSAIQGRGRSEACDQVQSAVVISIPVVNSSNEHLITDDDNDNNNGPISSIDLENIENNNAVDYIRNQNEIGMVIELSSYSRNRNLDAVTTASSENTSEQRITNSQNNNNNIHENRNTEEQQQINTSPNNDIQIEIEIKPETELSSVQHNSQTDRDQKEHSNNKYLKENQSSAENNTLQEFAISSFTNTTNTNITNISTTNTTTTTIIPDIINDSFSTKINISMPQNQVTETTTATTEATAAAATKAEIVESQNLYQNDNILDNSYVETSSDLNQQVTKLKNEESLLSSSTTSPLNNSILLKNIEINKHCSSEINLNNNDKKNTNISHNNNENINNKIQHEQNFVQETVPISSLFNENSNSKLIKYHQNIHNQYHHHQNHLDISGNNLNYKKPIESMTENFNNKNALDDENYNAEIIENNESNELYHMINIPNETNNDKIVMEKLSNDILTALKEETCSIKSESSEKSNETGSVEEALRALDIAIGDDPISENCSGGEEDDNSESKTLNDNNEPKEIEDEDSIPYENVIRDLLVTKSMGLNGLVIPNHLKTLNENSDSENEINNLTLQEKIKYEAMELVENIIDESRRIVEENTQILESKSFLEANQNQNFIVNYALIEHQNPMIEMNGHLMLSEQDNINDINDIEENLNKKTENLNAFSPLSNLKKLKSVESLECLFESEFLPSTSTPCIQNKFQNKFTFEPAPTKSTNGIKLFDCDNREVQADDQNSMELLSNSFDILCENYDKDSPKTDATFNANDKTYNANATYNANETYNAIKSNETFELNKTTICDANPNQNDFTYPGDPCSSKQAIERDQFLKPLIKYQREEITSEELNTITPVNTPIELNYNQETWDKMTKTTEDADYARSGWFLHPQEMISGNIGDENQIIITDKSTFDLGCEDQQEEEEEEEEDAEKLELTFDMLRKQLAEVLPQPQGVVGPLEFSDDDDEQQGGNRTFDEYRSPLDGIIGLLENEIEPPSSVAPNEVFINYKRTLSPIMEESETEETCKTFVMNETKCLDSTSTGCVETGEAIMGVTKTLMASNDTLFNFEDTLGDKEDCIASPRLSSQSDSQATTPVKSNDNRSTASSVATTITTSSDTEKCGLDNKHLNSHNAINDYTIVIPDRRSPPKTLSFAAATESQQDATTDFCSPVEQKTFSEGTTSTSTDRISSDISPTLDNETTFTMNTIDDKTCVTVIIKDDERISEISEPEWGSTASFNVCGTNSVQGADGGDTNACDMNSLTDVPSLDFNVNSFDKEFEVIGNNEIDNSHSEASISECLDYNKPIIIKAINGPLIIINAPNDKTSLDEEITTTESSNCLDDLNNQEEITNRIDSGPDDSGHSTQLSLDDKSNNTSHNISAQETDSIGDLPYNSQQQTKQLLQQEQKHISEQILQTDDDTKIDLSNKFNCKEFLQNEIEFSNNMSSQNSNNINSNKTQQILENGFVDDTTTVVTLYSSQSDDDIFHLEYSKENSDPNIKKLLYNNDSSNGTNTITDHHHNHQNNLLHNHVDRTKDKLLIGNGSITTGIPSITNGIGGVYSNKVQISNGHQDNAVIKMDKNLDISELEATNNVYHNCNELTSSIVLPSNKTNDELMVAEDVINHLSGEEDPWVESLHDIRFMGPGSADILSTSFTTASNSTSEWDSDVDDSHSSEEFMYVRGPSANAEILRYIKQEQGYSNDDEKDSDLWISNVNDNKPSKEKFKVGSADDDLVSEASSSEYEGEFVPSSWDSMAQPSRSALKSPDKNNSNSNDKKRRNVVFKKQRYHSVYEYPRENLSLSPAYSEPILSTHKHFYNFAAKNSLEEFDDGFIVSSSMRPFHGGSQFNACYTWPTDSDFSWSQVDDMDNYNTAQSLATYNEIKWTHPMSNMNNESNDVIDSPNKIEENQRPDSGVGESAEMLSDRQSLGELCHAKRKLRLPIEGLTTTPIFNQFSTINNTTIDLKINPQQQSKLLSSTIKPSFNSKDDDEPVSEFIPENIITTQKDVADIIIDNTNKMNFSTFGKRNLISSNNDEILMGNNLITHDKQKQRIAPKTILKYRQIKPAINIILIDDISGQQQQQHQQQQQVSTDIYHPENNYSYSSSSSSNESNPIYFRNRNNIIVNNCENNESNNINNEINNELILKSEKIRQSDSTDEDSGIESIMKLNNNNNRIESD